MMLSSVVELAGRKISGEGDGFANASFPTRNRFRACNTGKKIANGELPERDPLYPPLRNQRPPLQHPFPSRPRRAQDSLRGACWREQMASVPLRMHR